MSQRSEPLSIETLLQKQREEKEAASKVNLFCWQVHSLPLQPKFLSKEERAKLAIAKRAQEIKEERERTDRTRQEREVLERQAHELSEHDRHSRYTSQPTSRRMSTTVFSYAALSSTI